MANLITTTANNSAGEFSVEHWTSREKLIFRIAFIFFLIFALPTSWSWVERWFQINYTDIHFRDIFELSGYHPQFLKINTESGRWGAASYLNWLAILLFSVVAGLVWTFLVRKKEPDNYNKLYYWLRVIVRYRIAIGMIAFGYVKLFPQQMPAPSITVLNTELIHMQEQKIYWYSVGIVKPYEVFLGFVEVLGGVLMFSRRTTFWGALLTGVVLFNVGVANHVYDGGVHIYAFYFSVLSSLLVWSELRGAWQLLIQGKETVLHYYYPVFRRKWQYYLKWGIKLAIIIFYLPVYGYIMYHNNFKNVKMRKEPVTPGLAGSKGIYNVTEFKVNGKDIPFSPLDTVRWQTATFEKWSTLSYKVNNLVQIDQGNGGPARHDVDKNFEFSGIAGGQRFLYYDADTVNKVLHFQDKNLPMPKGLGMMLPHLKKKALEERERSRIRYSLNYSRPSDQRVILWGLNENQDSLYIVLDKIDKTYPLLEGRSNKNN